MQSYDREENGMPPVRFQGEENEICVFVDLEECAQRSPNSTPRSLKAVRLTRHPIGFDKNLFEYVTNVNYNTDVRFVLYVT